MYIHIAFTQQQEFKKKCTDMVISFTKISRVVGGRYRIWKYPSVCFFLCNTSKLWLKAEKKEEVDLFSGNYAVCSFSDKTAVLGRDREFKNRLLPHDLKFQEKKTKLKFISLCCCCGIFCFATDRGWCFIYVMATKPEI